MPRYLTPARICLLVLIQIYQAQQASSESSIDVLDFIAQHITASADDEDISLIEKLANAQNDIVKFAAELQQVPSQFPGRNVYDVLLQALWEVHGLDAMDELFATLRATVLIAPVDPLIRRVSPASPLGQYIRRCHVEYTRLQFADVQSLWDKFTAFRAPTYEDWASKNPQDAADLQEHDSELAPYTETSSLAQRQQLTSATGSTIDADNLLSFAIHQLQKMGNRVPNDVKAQLETWLREQSEPGSQPMQYFMAFFEHWRAGRYTSALDSLHQYFDYSLAARSGPDSTRIFYQYALLHLSVLHADFECWDQSIDAMNECIATARENQDTACLNYALSWLLYLRHAHPGKDSAFSNVSSVLGGSGNEQDEIKFLKTKARESKNWVLLSSTLLEEAKLEMLLGGITHRSQEHILQARYLNVEHGLRNLSLATATFHGASLERLGHTHLAGRIYETALAVSAHHSPLKDVVRLKCRLAHNLARSGQYTQALESLAQVMVIAQPVLKLQQKVLAVTMLVRLKRSLHRDNMDSARYYLLELNPVRNFGDPETIFEIELLEIEYNIRAKQLARALELVEDKISTTKKSATDIAQHLQLLILKMRILAAGGRASRGFTIAFRAASVAERHHLVPLLMEAVHCLAKILLEQGEYSAARALCESALPKVLESDHVELGAKMFVTIGEACVGLWHSQTTAAEQARCLKNAQDAIERGRDAYSRVEDLRGMLDCLAMKARVAKAAGDKVSADQADEIYFQLLEEHDEEMKP